MKYYKLNVKVRNLGSMTQVKYGHFNEGFPGAVIRNLQANYGICESEKVIETSKDVTEIDKIEFDRLLESIEKNDKTSHNDTVSIIDGLNQQIDDLTLLVAELGLQTGGGNNVG